MTPKKIRKIIGCVFAVASLLVTQIPTEDAIASDALQSDFQIVGSTLVKYTGTATTVSVPDSVKEIGEEAFANNSEMINLKLPSSVEKIGYAAFSGCNNLSAVAIPDSVEEIGTAAFSNCPAIKTVTIGSGLSKFGTGVFVGDPLLTTVTFNGNGKFVCDDGVIYDSDKNTIYEVMQGRQNNMYIMPQSVTDIKPYSFYGCKNITRVEFSNNLTEIPAYSFSFCRGLSYITIPYSVNLIDVKAFENCVNLTDVDIPISVTYIHDTAFDGCSKLNILAEPGSYAYEWFKHFDTSNVVIIDNEDNEVPEDENEQNESLVHETFPIEGLLGETVIVARNAVFFVNNTKQTVIEGPLNISDTDDYSEIIKDVEGMENVLQAETYGKGLSLPKFSIIGDTIAGKAFYGDTSLSYYEISKDITKIGDFAFSRSSLREITIPDTVTDIGYGAFYHCEDLATILIPATVTNIEPAAFEKTRMLDNWRLYGDSNFLIVGDGILVAYKGNSSNVTIPSNVKQIGPEVFKDHKEITDVSIADSVIRICEEAFSGCSNLHNVSGGSNVSRIEDRAFAHCPLDTIRIVDSVKSVGLGAFDYSDLNLDDSMKVSVFHGDIPVLSYNKTATRLTNNSYRVDAFNGCHIAIVKDESVNRVGTVLDRNISGFSGLVCVISEPNTEYFNGTLKVIDCTLTKEEANLVNIPYTVYAYGKGYNFIKSDLDSVINMAKDGAYFDEVDSPESFEIVGIDDHFVLNITKDEVVNSDVKDAYKRIYGDTVPQNMTTYDIGLRELDNEVMLTKLGKQSVSVSIPMPKNIPTSNLHIVCIDDEKQLEDLPYRVVDDDGVLSVTFDINHTGHYGIYSFNSTQVSLFNLDETPDTGDGLHPKWFLSIGLMAIGLILFLYKGKREII